MDSLGSGMSKHVYFHKYCQHYHLVMSRIREVWAPTLEAEMRNIRDLIEKYPYIAMVCVIVLFQIQQLTTILGYRVPWSCGTTNWNIQDVLRLPLPNHAL